jgi:hypothetical protein
MACILWGRAWQGQVVHVHSDNEAVVAVVNSGYSKDQQLMHLARCLFFALAARDISLYARHIPLNTVADAISRDNLPLLFSKVPDADSRPAVVPPDLVVTQPTRLDSPKLEAIVRELFTAGLASSTQRTY